MLIDAPIQFIIAAFSVGISKGGLASAGAIAVPFLSLWVDPLTAASILLPIYVVSDFVGVFLYRKDFSKKNVLILSVAIALGVGIATLVTPYVSETLLTFCTGVIGLFYCVSAWLPGRAQRGPTSPSWPKGLFWGTLTGLSSFIAHAGAPPAQAYLLPQKMNKLTFSGTITLSFAIGNLLKIPSYVSLGLFEEMNWGFVAMLALVAIGGTALGRLIAQKLPQASYVRLIEILLFCLSLVLVGRAMARWLL